MLIDAEGLLASLVYVQPDTRVSRRLGLFLNLWKGRSEEAKASEVLVVYEGADPSIGFLGKRIILGVKSIVASGNQISWLSYLSDEVGDTLSGVS